MKKRILSIIFAAAITISTVLGLSLPAMGYNIDEADNLMWFYSAEMATYYNNPNIFYAQFYAQDLSGERSVENMLRERSSSMLYHYFADMERDNIPKNIFEFVWNVANLDMDRFSGMTEVDFYSGLLWTLMTGDFKPTAYELESKMENFNDFSNGLIWSWVEAFCLENAAEYGKEKIEEAYRSFASKDKDTLETVQDWYEEYQGVIILEQDKEGLFFDSIDEVQACSETIMKLCDSALEYLTKLSQLETLYYSTRAEYDKFLETFASMSGVDPQLRLAANNILRLLREPTFKEALKELIVNIVCLDLVEFSLEQISNLMQSALETVATKLSTGFALGIKIGAELANALYNIEDRMVARFYIILLSDMSDIVFDTTELLGQTYYASLLSTFAGYKQDGKTDETRRLSDNANNYVCALEMCYRFLLQTNIYSEKYLSGEYGGWWDFFWEDGEEIYQTHMESLKSEIKTLETHYDNVKTDANALYEDYRDMLVNQIEYHATGWENVPEAQTKRFYVDVRLSDKVPTKEGYEFCYWSDSTNGGKYYPGDVFNGNFSDDIILTPVYKRAPTKRDKAVARAHEWYKTWILTDDLILWHNPETSAAITIPKGTKVMGVPYTQISCKYTIDGTLPGSGNYFALTAEQKYDTVVNTSLPGISGNRTAPRYGAECVQLVYDAWYHGDPDIGTRDVNWSTIIGSNKDRGLVTEVAWSEVLPGDALGIQTHIMLVTGVDNKNTPADCTDDVFSVIEQTTSYLGHSNGYYTNIGTTLTGYTYSYLTSKGYVPYRYVKLGSPSDGEASSTQYTISYDANGGASAPEPQIKTHGVALEISNTVIIREGYIFKGWSLSPDAAEAEYSIGDSFTLDSNTVLYAVWAKDPSVPEISLTLVGSIVDATEGGIRYGQGLVGARVDFYDSKDNYVGYAIADGEGAYRYTFKEYGVYKRVFSKIGYKTVRDDYLVVSKASIAMGVTVMFEKDASDRDIIASGSCGTDLTWALDSEGLLTLDGTGAMERFVNPWKEYRSQIVSVVIGDSVTGICEDAFSHCDSLREVYMGANLTQAYSYTFMSCENLKTVTLPNAWTFYTYHHIFDNTNVTTVIIPDRVTSVCPAMLLTESVAEFVCEDTDGYGYFDEDGILYYRNTDDTLTLVRSPAAKNVKRYKVLEGTTVIGDNAFDGVASLTDVELPDGLVDIGAYAFRSTGLVSVDVPDTVTHMDRGTFSYCKSLTDVYMGANLIYVFDGTFAYCDNLDTITVPNAISFMDYNDIFKNSPVKKVIIPESVTSVCAALRQIDTIEEFDCRDRDGYGYFDDDGILYYRNTDGALTLVKSPSAKQISSYKVLEETTVIGDNAFDGVASLTDVELPDGLVDIGAYVFRSTGLVSVDVPDTVTHMDRGTFSYCKSLTDVYMGANLIYVFDGTFAYCDNLDTITVPNAISFMDYNDIFKNSPVKKVIIPESVTSVCAALYLIPSIEEFVCEDTDGYGYFDVDGVLYHRPADGALTVLRCPISRGYTVYDLPNDTVTVGAKAFEGHVTLKEIYLPAGLRYIEGAAFSGCSGLESLYVPNSVERIDHNAFIGCASLREVYIGKGVTTVGQTAFSSCTGLDSVYFYGNKPVAYSDPFSNSGELTVYRTAESTGWAEQWFTHPVEIFDPADVSVSAKELILSDTAVSVSTGNNVSVEALFYPFNTTDKRVVWTSSDPSVATVDSNGIVTAVGVGETVITALSADGGYTASCTVTVTLSIGDVNGDTVVNSDDAVAILRYLAGYDSTGYDIANGDYNKDGVTNSDDAVAILRMLAGYVD